ncbi:MAG TPA: Crp/Fnr family transcriptional regulator [Rhodocyclaceae bacterium]|nr:Crp/Fnr family transcriptional regulator [Rhodocyclaceae bacterium]
MTAHKKANQKLKAEKVKEEFPRVALPRSVFFRARFVSGSRLRPLPLVQPEKGELVRTMRRFELFSKLPLKALRELASATTVRLYRRGEFLWRRDDKVKDIVLLDSGFVKAARRDRNGASKTYGLYGPGDCLGLFATFAGMKHSIDAVALNEGLKAICIDAAVLLKFAETSPLLSSNLHGQLTRFTEALIKKIEIISAGTMPQRLAVLMLQLIERYGIDRKDDRVHLPISLTLEQLSEIIDARLETVARVLGDWKRAGWLSIDATGCHFSHLDKIRELLVD